LLLESSREEVHEMQEFLTVKAASERQGFRRCMASVLRGNESDVGRSSCCRGASVASGRVLLDDCRSDGLRRGFFGLFHLVFDIIGANLANLVLGDNDVSGGCSSRDGAGGSSSSRRDECRSGGGGTTTSSDGRSRLAHSARFKGVGHSTPHKIQAEGRERVSAIASLGGRRAARLRCAAPRHAARISVRDRLTRIMHPDNKRMCVSHEIVATGVWVGDARQDEVGAARQRRRCGQSSSDRKRESFREIFIDRKLDESRLEKQ
jgi:hypothetical protein